VWPVVLRCPGTVWLPQVNAYLFDGYWEDIGTIKSFFEENLKLAQM
jgi:glucose-1-phosphate adenylyltransferase